MKRILSFLSLMVLSLFTIVACSKADNTLAQDLVDSIILEQEGSAVEGDFGLISELSREDKTYPLKWESNSKYVKIADKADAGTLSYRATVNRNVPEEQTVTLTATAEANGGKASRNFEILVLPYELYDFIEEYRFPLEGSNLYGEYTLDKEFTLPNAPESAKIEWSTDKPELINVDNANGKMTVALKFDKVEAVMTAKWSYKGEIATKNYAVNVLQQTIYEPEAKVEENTPYVFGLLQKNLENSYIWMNGKIADKKRGATTKNLAEAKEFYLEKATGGFHIYFKEGNAKKYMNSTKDRVLSFDDSAAENCVWAWDADGKTVLAKVEGETYFLGTYGKFNTISVSTMDHFKGNFVLQLYTKSNIEASTPTFEDDVMGNYEYKRFTLDNMTAGVNNLPVEGKRFSDVKLSYEVKTGKDFAKVEGNKITLSEIDHNEKIVLTVTFTCGTYTKTKDVEFELLATVSYVKELVAGNAYRFGLIQKNLEGKTLWSTGKMSSNPKTKYYGELVENEAEGALFFVEAVEGGYHLYCLVDGVKKYVNLTSGEHVNLKFEDAASSVWVWNAEKYILTTKAKKGTMPETDYYLGTFAQNKTLSASPIDKLEGSFEAHFYAPKGVTALQAGTAYKMAMNQKNLKQILYVNGAMDGFYAASTTNYDEAVDAYVEVVEGGYHLYVMVAGAKKYINLTSGKYVNLKFEDAASSVWAWDATYNTLTTKAAKEGVEDTYFLGTFDKNKTFSGSAYSYLAKGNFYVEFIPAVASAATPEPDPILPTKMTIAEAFASAEGQLPVVTGKVVAVTKDSVILSDATGSIRVNFGKLALPELGATIKVSTAKEKVKASPVLTATAAFEAATAIEVAAPTPVEYGVAESDAYFESNREVVFVKVTGRLSVSGNYLNVNFLTPYKNCYSLNVSNADLDNVKALNGKVVEITGYLYQADYKYLQVAVTTFKDVTTDQNLVDFSAEDAVAALPKEGSVVDAVKTVKLEAESGVTFTVAVTGTSVVWDATKSELTITPVEAEEAVKVVVVFTKADVTKTVTVEFKTKLDNSPRYKLVFSELGYADPTDLTTAPITAGDATLTFDKGTGRNESKYYPSDTTARIYSGNTLTVASAKKIVKIVFTLASNSVALDTMTIDGGTIAGNEWTGSATSILFTNGGSKQLKIQAMEIYFEA